VAGRAKVTRLDPPGSLDLVSAVQAAGDSMGWLDPSDRAMLALALRYAQTIEDAHLLAERLADLDVSDRSQSMFKRVEALEAMADAQKAIGWIGPHLANALKSLGGAPAERKALGVEEAVRGRLAELRSARRRNTKGVDASAS
jgi:hypothetical protein